MTDVMRFSRQSTRVCCGCIRRVSGLNSPRKCWLYSRQRWKMPGPPGPGLLFVASCENWQPCLPASTRRLVSSASTIPGPIVFTGCASPPAIKAFGSAALLLMLGPVPGSSFGEMTPIRAFQLLLCPQCAGLALGAHRGADCDVGWRAPCAFGPMGCYVSSQGETLPVQLLITLVGLLWGAPFLIFFFLFVRARTLAEA